MIYIDVKIVTKTTKHMVWFSEHLLLHRVARPRPGNCCDRCEAKFRNHSRGPQQSSGQRQVQRSLLIWLVASRA